MDDTSLLAEVELMSGFGRPETKQAVAKTAIACVRAVRPSMCSRHTAIADLVAIRVEEAVESSDLDAKTFSLVNLAALIATGGDDASHLLHVGAALDAGASVDEVTGVLTAIAPNVGVFKMVAAADPLATALGITIAEDDAGDAS